MGHILYGFRKNEQGIIVSKQFDSDVLFGTASHEGWYDSPDKIPGSGEIIADEAAQRAATAGTTGQRVESVQEIYGAKRKPGRPRKIR